MQINVGVEVNENKQLAKTVIIRVDLDDASPVAIDEDFQDRTAKVVRQYFLEEVAGTRDLD